VQVLYFADIRFPLERANGIQTMHTCAALAARGHSVVLHVRRDTQRPARDPFVFYGVTPDPRLRVVRARTPGSPALRRLAYLASVLIRTLHPRRPDVILTRDLGVASLLLRMPRSLRPPLVYESHGFAPAVSQAMPELLSDAGGTTGRKQRRLTAREQRTWKEADAYVAITRTLAEELTGRFGPRDLVAIVPDGVRLPAERVFVPARPAAVPTVGYAGHLYPWKGVDVLLDALALLPDVAGLIIGGHGAEPDLQRARTRAEALGIAARVRFTGAVEPSRVLPRLAEADILVVPNTATTLSARYTSPLKLFEYLAAGKPIVASDLPSLREVLSDGGNAVLVGPGDPAALAAGIRRVLDDPRLAESIARRAFDDAARFTWACRAERLEAVFEWVADRSRRPIGRAAASGGRTTEGEPSTAAGSTEAERVQDR